ncbi:alpha/beta hydrolase [Acaricomes phytoseiuli]|uniref:alpha/beta hydrolase n=1 Tax=Acaricomes phytoseiuli TaxID=291968 RepID=UPI002222AC4B|nr:alpha/beta hydrolase [Acaricomes phytoseiuli]MCW1250641.1 alpha/beta hydrolase [Acaricomes phytoseiuli]
MPGTECGSLSVPVDYSAQGKGANRFNLQVYRLKAADQSAKRGTIMNFPSGPGASGDEGFATIRQFTQEYDLIGADLRGTGLSGPLECSTEDILKIPYIPPTDSVAMNKLVENQRSFWSTCRTQPENLKGNLDAFSNAKDAESIRKALGLGKISLYGFSYGTLTAQRYLGLFGGNVSSSILEGVMNPNQSRREFVMTAAAGVETIYGQLMGLPRVWLTVGVWGDQAAFASV